MFHLILPSVVKRLRDFRNGTAGSVAIEALLLMPILFWAYLAMFSFFDMLRQQSLNQKTSFTIADMLSRETDFINDTYITNAHNLFKTAIRSDSSTAMRISVLKWSDSDDKFLVDWSKVRGPSTALTDGAVATWKQKLPLMPSNERIILVETWTDYEIPFETGMDDFEINTFTFIRPRFAPQLPFSNTGSNNGTS
ncbi:MAG: TadE/TadG family type IV pilus assembly protein [Pseudooceanicola sp.]